MIIKNIFSLLCNHFVIAEPAALACMCERYSITSGTITRGVTSFGIVLP